MLVPDDAADGLNRALVLAVILPLAQRQLIKHIDRALLLDIAQLQDVVEPILAARWARLSSPISSRQWPCSTRRRIALKPFVAA